MTAAMITPPEVAMLQQALMDPPSVTPETEQPRGLTEDDIRSIVEGEIQAALTVTEGDLADNRRTARDYYNRRQVGLLAAEKNKSSVVTAEVRDTINWAMPGFMRTFFGGRDMARFDPTRPDQTPFAKQATDTINHVFLNECDGFLVTYDLIKNSLLEKNGPGRVWTEIKTEVCYERYQQVTTMQVTQLVLQEGVELLAAEPSGPPIGTVDAVTGQPVQVLFWDIEVKLTKKRARLRVKAIPPENFLHTPRAERVDDDIPFVGERYPIPKSDLIALGYDRDTVMDLPSGDPANVDAIRNERYQDETSGMDRTSTRHDEMEEVWLTDCYVRIDQDGDGIAELRHIVCAGETGIKILSNDYAKYPPYFDLCPMPMPHTIHGESYFDLVGDLQLITSVLMRNELDNIYRLNNGRWEVQEGMVEIDDLLDNQAGGIVRSQQIGSVKALEMPALGAAPSNMRAELEGIRQNRTGMSRASQGLDASSLRNTTATGVTQMMAASQAIQELIARVYAEGGLKRLFLLMLREYVSGPFKKESIQIRGKWIDVDPSTWDAEMNVSITVGLGVGQATERIQNLSLLQADQAQLVQMGFGGYMVTPENAKALIDEKVEAMGFRFNPFFTDPQGPPPPPPPNPLMIEAQSKADKVTSDRQVDAARIQNEGRETELDVQLKLGELALKKQELDIRLITDRERIAQNAQIEREKIQASIEIARLQAQAQAASRTPPADAT